MSVQVKICGLRDEASVEAAAAHGAAAVGFMFYPPSPRAVDLTRASELSPLAGTAFKVGVFVEPDDALIRAAADAADLDMIQLHGQETTERVQEIRALTDRPVMKAIKVESAEDVEKSKAYFDVADWLLFDAKAPKTFAGALPGGNGLAFDWQILAKSALPEKWMLAGGLAVDNVAEAVAVTRASWVDVSSGVEAAPGRKSPAQIAAFLKATRSL